ncbi:MAG: tetratricopeptide repeat protein, partial [Bacteroidales bacterium]|nr:tetratricopeptide repeat protein [Bacteroidales bacterium]
MQELIMNYVRKTSVIITLLIAILFSQELMASYYNSGLAYYRYRKYEKARIMLKKAIKAWPRHGNAYFFLGMVEMKLQKYDDAQKSFESCIKNPTKYKYLKLAFDNLIVLAKRKN